MEILYQIVTIFSGVLLLGATLIHIAQKKMDVGIGTSWTVMAMIIIVFGSVFDFERLVGESTVNVVLIFIFSGALVVALYLYGLRITELKKRANDIAIWVSIIRKDTYKFRGNDNASIAEGENKNAEPSVKEESREAAIK